MDATSNEPLIARQLVILAGALKDIGAPSLDEIAGRMDTQKRVYLLQVAGISLGYRFTWDLFGPFSKGLANDMALLSGSQEVTENLISDLHLKQEAAQIFAKVRQLIDTPQDYQGAITNLEWLELIASLHFLAMSYGGWRPIASLRKDERNDVFGLLVERKEHLKEYHDASAMAFDLLESVENPEKAAI